MTPDITSPRAIAEAGIKIYEARYKAEYEGRYPGKFVAINIADQSATVGDTVSSTLKQAKASHPVGLFHVIRVGHSGAFEAGFSHRHVGTHRVL